MQPTGITVRLFPDGSATYPEATSANVGAGGSLVVLRAGQDGSPEAIDEIPHGRWVSWTPGIEPDTA